MYNVEKPTGYQEHIRRVKQQQQRETKKSKPSKTNGIRVRISKRKSQHRMDD